MMLGVVLRRGSAPHSDAKTFDRAVSGDSLALYHSECQVKMKGAKISFAFPLLRDGRSAANEIDAVGHEFANDFTP
jgi:hypothetical protein